MALNANAVVTKFSLETGVKAVRKMLKTYFNSGTAESPIWELLGVGVEDSSIDYAPDVTTLTDITGVTSTTVNKLEMTQDLEPMTIIGGQKLAVELEDIVARMALGEFATKELMIVKEHIPIGDSGAVYAERHKNCTIYPQSIGGSSTLDMPLNVTFSNDKTLGSVTFDAAGAPTFIASAAA